MHAWWLGLTVFRIKAAAVHARTSKPPEQRQVGGWAGAWVRMPVEKKRVFFSPFFFRATFRAPLDLRTTQPVQR